MKGVGELIRVRGDIKGSLYTSILIGHMTDHNVIDLVSRVIVGSDVKGEIGSRVPIRVLLDIYNQRSNE
jgi:hypothetical protein